MIVEVLFPRQEADAVLLGVAHAVDRERLTAWIDLSFELGGDERENERDGECTHGEPPSLRILSYCKMARYICANVDVSAAAVSTFRVVLDMHMRDAFLIALVERGRALHDHIEVLAEPGL